MYSDIEGYDQSALFEKTATGIHINREELQRLNEEYEKGEVRFRQMINDPNDQYLGRYAFISETLWHWQNGRFVCAGEPAE